MDLSTNRKLKNGREVNLGDKLKGKQTAEVVVLKDDEPGKFCVQVISNKLFVFDLDKFLNEWDDLEYTGSVLERN